MNIKIHYWMLLVLIQWSDVFSSSIKNISHESDQHPMKIDTILENTTSTDDLSSDFVKQTISNSTHKKHYATRIHLAGWRWQKFGKILVFAMGLVLAGVVKLVFHHTKILSAYMPESCALIVVGIFLGTFQHIFADHHTSINDYLPKFTGAITPPAPPPSSYRP